MFPFLCTLGDHPTVYHVNATEVNQRGRDKSAACDVWGGGCGGLASVPAAVRIESRGFAACVLQGVSSARMGRLAVEQARM